MTRSFATFRKLALIVSLAAAVMVTGCAGKKKVEDGLGPNSDMGTESTSLGDSDSGQAMGLVTVHFPYDSFSLTGESKTALKNNAKILKDNASVKIQIEGHCDSSGGIQYNIALGEKRANAVKKYLQDLGVSGDRITTISYGKERLLDPSGSEEANAKNRRANFVITSR